MVVEENGVRSEEIFVFRYITDVVPEITALEPNEGPYTRETPVTIRGTDLGGVTQVNFGTTVITAITPVTGGVQFTTPSGTVNKMVAVTVTAPAGTSNELMYRFTPPAPTITSITPERGIEAGGYDVTITGTFLDQPGLEVTFGGTPATISSKSDTSLTVVVPPGGEGVKPVVVRTNYGEATTSFTYYKEGAPTISGITPSFGLLQGGTQVWITGTGFATASKVTFNGLTAQFVKHSDTSISAITPDLSALIMGRSAAIPVVVRVTNHIGESPAENTHFAVYPLSVPVIDSISPASGPPAGGNWIIINGSGFTGATAVTFGLQTVTSPTVNSDASVSVQVPAGTGKVQVTVVGPAGTSNAKEYSYEGARPDPSQDPEVRGIVNAHVSTADRFIQLQSGTVGSRLSSIRRRGLSGMRSNNFNFRVNNSMPRIGRHDRRNIPQSHSPVYSFNTTQAFPSLASQQLQSRWAFWSDGAINIGSDKDEDGYDYTTYNLTLGADYAFDAFAGGFAIGYANDQSDVGDNGSETSGDAYTAVMYGSYSPASNFYLEGMLGYSHLTLDSKRYLGFGSGFVDGSRNGHQYFGTVAGGYDMMLGNLTLNPYGKFSWSRSTLNEYAESGAGNRALRYGRTKIDHYATSLGVRAEYAIRQEWGTLLPSAGLEYTYNFKGGTRTGLGYIDQMGMPYTVNSRATARNQISANARIQAIVYNKYSIGMEYRGTFSGKQRDHRVSLQAGWSY
ncbi:MAG: IPT/TIG domain-containing protein [Planctomycetaceae bacterium]|nr:IPT/TIG domain-containing protein [Planctomycetaceae bacterium]